MAKLTESEIAAVIAAHPGWRLMGTSLVRELVFKNFAQAVAFVNRVADLAEQANHHPDMIIRHNGVRLELTSHDAGGITERDAAMVKLLNTERLGCMPQ